MEEDKCCYCSYRGKILKTSTIKACGKSAVEFTDNIRNYTYMAILYRIKILSIRSMKINDQFNCRKKSRRKESGYFHHFNFFPSAEI